MFRKEGFSTYPLPYISTVSDATVHASEVEFCTTPGLLTGRQSSRAVLVPEAGSCKQSLQCTRSTALRNPHNLPAEHITCA